jgi:DNA helicase-2/ATP-dependent DNA helicase PcrA
VDQHGDLLGDLTPAQREAVLSTAAPLCIMAGAGSGKTRVLTRRIAYRLATGTADPRHVLALTFTRRAAAELSGRLRALGVRDRVTAGTFHAVALAQLRQRWADRGEPAPALLTRKGKLVATILAGRSQVASGGLINQEAGSAAGGMGGVGGAAAGGVGAVVAEIEWAQARLVTPESYRAAVAGTRRRSPLPIDDMAAIYARYQTEKRRRRLVDFDDLLIRLAIAVETDPEFAAASRWRWRHLFVDEFQDLNPLQYRVLTGWLGASRDLCVVGDPNQAIYAWNGADPILLTEFTRRHPEAEVIRLDTNHRSSPQVVAVARAVLASGAAAGAVSGASPVECSRPDGPAATVRVYPTELSEARGIASALRLQHGPGVAWSHLAVLARTNAQLAVIERALRVSGIPCRLPGGTLLERPEIRAALGTLDDDGDRAPLAARLPDLAGLGRDEPDAERRHALAVLADLGREYAQLDASATVAGFQAWLAGSIAADRGADPCPPADAVTLSTFHRAKGLEWPVVYLVGLEEGLVPLGPNLEEERRLLYVGLTRAEREVHCSWAARRSFGGRPAPRQPSPWLVSIEAAAGGTRTAPAPGGEGAAAGTGVPAELQRARARLRLAKGDARWPAPADPVAGPDVLVALQAWRRGAARDAQVAPHVVCHDATLAALAVARPSTPSELLAVPGLGPVKAARYGEALLALVARHGRTA